MNLVRCSAVLPQIVLEGQRGPRQKSTAEVLALVDEIRKLRLKENAAKTRKQKVEACSTTRDKRSQLTALLRNKGIGRLMARVEEIETVEKVDKNCLQQSEYCNFVLKYVKSLPFAYTVGISQGDRFSPITFTTSLESVLKKVRPMHLFPSRSSTGIPY